VIVCYLYIEDRNATNRVYSAHCEWCTITCYPSSHHRDRLIYTRLKTLKITNTAVFGLHIVLFSSTKAMSFILHNQHRFTLVIPRTTSLFLRNHLYTHPFPAASLRIQRVLFQVYGFMFIKLFKTSQTITSFQRKIMYAQDRECRDVVIKLVETDSAEHRIHARLMSCAEFNEPESFPFIIPTLDILPSPHNFSFVVTPR
jgi:hypothetical protein